MSHNLLKLFVYLLAITALLLAACSQTAAPTQPEQAATEAAQAPAEELQAAEAEEPVATEEPAATEEQPSLPPLPAAPQELEITTADGRVLEAYYYPAAVNPAPIVVLMHWAGGDMNDWREIAPWLQNRRDELGSLSWSRSIAGSNSRQVDGPWLDSSWFPPMPADLSFGVLAFNFGGYGGSQAGAAADSLSEDARAAVQAAAELEGADPNQVAALGASIGADGAVDGCYLYNASVPAGACIGALSLSPGNFITDQFTYAEAVLPLDQAGYPVWCLTAFEDYSAELCESVPDTDVYLPIFYPGNLHGMMLIQPDLYPVDPDLGVDTLVVIQDWLEQVFGVIISE